VAAGLEAGIEVFSLLGLFMAGHELGGILVAVGRRIGVGDTNVKDGRLTALPESTASNVATVIGRDLGDCAVGISRSWVLTGGDERVVRHRTGRERLGAEGVPLPSHLIVAGEDEAALPAVEAMLDGEALGAAITMRGKGEGGEAKAEAEAVAEFFG
jgi:hypothetical protein